VRFHQDVLKPELLTGYVKFKRGEPLNVNRVLALQSALADSPYWGRVEVITRQDEAKDLEVPIDVNLTPAKPLRFSGGVGYGTDTGPRARGIVELRRLNDLGHRAEIDAIFSGIERGVKTSYLIPGAYPRTDLLSLNVAFDRLDTNTSRSDSGLVGATLTESRHGWREAYSLNFQRETFTVGLDHGTSNLVVPGVSLERVKADDRIDTTNGYRVRLSLQGADAAVLSDSSFLQGSIDGKIIRTLGDRNRLIARTQVGYTDTNDFRALPPRFRFFAGGDQSVRGFSYQSLGRKDEAGNTIGGETLAVASLEYERRFFTKWGAAVFYDTGNASQSFSGLGTLARGAGFGLRWRSPIGPIRADVAWALSEPGHPLRFHLNIGPDL
jgi:translocation and assembly module TamA